MRFSKLLIRLFLLAAVLFSSAASGTRAEETVGSGHPERKILARGSLSQFGRMPVVKLRVDKKLGLFAIHTCTNTTILDDGLCQELKLKPQDKQTATSKDQLFDPPEFYLGETKVDWITAVRSLDCQALSNDLGHEISGVLGIEMLSNLSLLIDPDEDLVALSLAEDGFRPAWRKSSLAVAYGNVPAVLVELPGRVTELFRIDTSLNYNGTISKETFDRLKESDTSLITKKSIYFGDKAQSGSVSDSVQIPELKIWSLNHSRLFWRVEKMNCLGNDFLLRHRLTIDFMDGIIYSAPSKLFGAVDGNSQFGIQFKASTIMKEILNVENDSLAARAGVRPGDKLVSVDGYSIDTQMFLAYRELRAPSTSDREVICTRDGKQLKFLLGGKPR